MTYQSQENTKKDNYDLEASYSVFETNKGVHQMEYQYEIALKAAAKPIAITYNNDYFVELRCFPHMTWDMDKMLEMEEYIGN